MTTTYLGSGETTKYVSVMRAAFHDSIRSMTEGGRML